MTAASSIVIGYDDAASIFVPSGVTAAEGDGRPALHQIQRDRLGPAAPAGRIQAQDPGVQGRTHTCRETELCISKESACPPRQQPTLFLFQSLIAALCSNTSGLDKDSLTLRAIYVSRSPTSVPMRAPCLIYNLYE